MSRSQERQFEEKQLNEKESINSGKSGKRNSFVLEVIREFNRIINSLTDVTLKLWIPFALVAGYRFYGLIKPYILEIATRAKSTDWIVLALLALSIIFTVIINYLQDNNNNKKNDYYDLLRARVSAQVLDDKWDTFNTYNTIVEKKAAHHDANSAPNIKFDAKQKQEIHEAVVASVTKNLSADFFDSLRNSIKTQLVDEKKSQLALLSKRSEASVKRLTSEIAQLSRRANTNLAIGSTVTIAALAALSYFIVHEDFNSGDIQKAVLHFIPRLSLVLFIEFFSFFFLKLYRANLQEIKYYQNELTNLEVSAIAVEFAVNYGREDDITTLVKEMALTERNFKLQKGESTVELERSRVETHDIKEVLKAALGAAYSKKEKS